MKWYRDPFIVTWRDWKSVSASWLKVSYKYRKEAKRTMEFDQIYCIPSDCSPKCKFRKHKKWRNSPKCNSELFDPMADRWSKISFPWTQFVPEQVGYPFDACCWSFTSYTPETKNKNFVHCWTKFLETIFLFSTSSPVYSTNTQLKHLVVFFIFSCRKSPPSRIASSLSQKSQRTEKFKEKSGKRFFFELRAYKSLGK